MGKRSHNSDEAVPLKKKSKNKKLNPEEENTSDHAFIIQNTKTNSNKRTEFGGFKLESTDNKFKIKKMKNKVSLTTIYENRKKSERIEVTKEPDIDMPKTSDGYVVKKKNKTKEIIEELNNEPEIISKIPKKKKKNLHSASIENHDKITGDSDVLEPETVVNKSKVKKRQSLQYSNDSKTKSSCSNEMQETIKSNIDDKKKNNSDTVKDKSMGKIEELNNELETEGNSHKKKKKKLHNGSIEKQNKIIAAPEKVFKKSKGQSFKVKDTTTKLICNKAKKIIFVNDEPHDVPICSELINNVINENKSKKFLNDDEAEVKDEDIDKFCDEIDEEDNKQYEDWIKLIEAKMHSNKKTI